MMRAGRVAATFVLAAVAFLTVATAPALAVKAHPFLFGFKLPGKENEGMVPGLAINQATHLGYAVNETSIRPAGEGIYEFEPDGSVTRMLVSPPEFRGEGLAVDNSSGATAGYIYVTERKGNFPGEISSVQQFDAAGTATAVRIKDSAIPPDGTPQLGLPPVVHHEEFLPTAVAVDSDGHVYVGDKANTAINKFTPSGVFIEQLTAGVPEFSRLGLAIAPNGHIYLARSTLVELDSSGACVNSCESIGGMSGAHGVTVDSAGTVFATDNRPLGQGTLKEFDQSGTLISQTPLPEMSNPWSIAVDETTDRIYVGDLTSVNEVHARAIKVYGPLLTLPDATTEDATDVTDQSATFHGAVGADDGPPPPASSSMRPTRPSKRRASRAPPPFPAPPPDRSREPGAPRCRRASPI